MIYVELTKGVIDAESARQRAEAAEHGAVMSFFGNVRNRHEDRDVLRVDYSAYEPMAKSELMAIAGEMSKAHAIGAIVIIHRLGSVVVGETSLLVVVGSAHRRAAFDCGLAIIDEIKRRVPIWKREISPDGERWQDGHVPGPS